MMIYAVNTCYLTISILEYQCSIPKAATHVQKIIIARIIFADWSQNVLNDFPMCANNTHNIPFCEIKLNLYTRQAYKSSGAKNKKFFQEIISGIEQSNDLRLTQADPL